MGSETVKVTVPEKVPSTVGANCTATSTELGKPWELPAGPSVKLGAAPCGYPGNEKTGATCAPRLSPEIRHSVVPVSVTVKASVPVWLRAIWPKSSEAGARLKEQGGKLTAWPDSITGTIGLVGSLLAISSIP